MVYPEVTFGVEHRWGSYNDYAFVNVVRRENGKIEILSVNEPEDRSLFVHHEPGMILYADREGRPFNMKELHDKAKESAELILDAPFKVQRFHYKYDGFHSVDASGAVTQVSFYVDGDRPFTEILVNDYQGTTQRGGRSVDRKRRDFESATIVTETVSGRARLQKFYDYLRDTQ
jgi:hypothetical protein